MSQSNTAPALREGQHWQVNGATGCWEWLGYTYRGYARCISGQAHREVWRQSGRELAREDDLHHRCKNKACVNPEHLEPVLHGPHQREHHRRLTDAEVRLARQLRAAGWTQPRIAARLGVASPTISAVVRGQTYAGV